MKVLYLFEGFYKVEGIPLLTLHLHLHQEQLRILEDKYRLWHIQA